MKPEQVPAIPIATTAPAFAEIQRTRQQLAAALERAERDYRTLVENAVEGVFRTTPDGRFIMANLALPGTLAAATAAGLPAATDLILSLDAMCHALWQASGVEAAALWARHANIE